MKTIVRQRAEYAQFTGDLNDCSVRAVVVATGVSYPTVYAMFKELGRRDGHGTPTWMTDQVLRRLAPRLTHESLYGERPPSRRNPNRRQVGYPTLKRWLRTHLTGTYVVCNQQHMFAVVNGVVHDWGRSTSGARVRLVQTWRVD